MTNLTTPPAAQIRPATRAIGIQGQGREIDPVNRVSRWFGRTARPGAFTAIWFGLTLAFSVVCLGLQQPLHISGDVLSIVMFAPTLAALAARALCGRPRFLITCKTDRRTFTRMIVASVVFSCLAWAGEALVEGTWGRLPLTVAGVPLVAMAALQFLGAWTEEVGYKGVLYSYLSGRFRTVTAIVIQGVIFGVIHMQYWGDGPGAVAWFLFGTSGLVAAIPAVWTGSFGQRMVAAAIMHFGVNMAGFAFAESGTITAHHIPGFAIGIWCGALPLILGRRLILRGRLTKP